MECTLSSFGLVVLHATSCKDGRTQGTLTHKAGSGERSPTSRKLDGSTTRQVRSGQEQRARRWARQPTPTRWQSVDAGQETSKARHRSQQRLASHGKAMGYLKGLVFKRWIGAVRQEKQQREKQRRAEAAASAEAAAAAAAQAARERELSALRRELDGV